MTPNLSDSDSMLPLWEGVLLQAWEGVLYPHVGFQGMENEAQLFRRQSPYTALARVVAGLVAAWFADWFTAHTWQKN